VSGLLPEPDERARVGVWVFVSGWFVLVVGLGLLQRCTDSHASDVPPLIGEVRGVVRDVRRVLHDERPAAREAQPADALMCVAPLELGADEITLDERRAIERQIDGCWRRPGRHADPWALLELLRLEDQLGVPDESRGILAAVWCVEGALRSDRVLRGDPRGGVAQAHGPMQLWPWHRAWCGLTKRGADDLVGAARCYWSRVVDRREARAIECSQSWRVGEALAANGPAYLPLGCEAESSHWRTMESMR